MCLKIIVIGGDGYCGWASSLHLAARGHDVTIVDNFVRRAWDRELGVSSLTPIQTLEDRLLAWSRTGGRPIDSVVCDATDYPALLEVFRAVRPGAIVHFGQQRSAPFSMMNREAAVKTLCNNTIGNMNVLWAMREAVPDAHLVKLGTMGEYGTPNIDIEEGFINIEHKGRTDRLPFPKQPGSFYHLTKTSDSDHIYFTCRSWGLRATDLNQGIVYGLSTEETEAASELGNRLDYDGIFGTVLNRFCIEAALGYPLTVYGLGGQTRTFINIRDTARCVALAVESPADPGEFRVFNQFTEIFSVLELANRVKRVAARLGLEPQIQHIRNPRVERETHYYSSTNEHLLSLGLRPHLLEDRVLEELIATAARFADRIDRAQIEPTVTWTDRSEPDAVPARKRKALA
jgi:UDP-sulfoquinovose synthase